MPSCSRLRYLESHPRTVSVSWGDREPAGTLVLLHAFPLGARMWEPQHALADEGWRIVMPQFRGFDCTTCDVPVAASLEDYARDVADLRDARGGTGSRRWPVDGRLFRSMMTRPDSTPLLSSIAVPTLVIVGDEDVLTPPPASASMAAAIRHAELVHVPMAGHLSSLEQPRAFNDALVDFLARLRS